MPHRRINAGSGLVLLGLTLLAIFAPTVTSRAQSSNLPPKPAGYFTDLAGVVDAATGHAINEQLAQFERDTSNQILVAIFPSLPDGADASQYSIDAFNAWRPGQKGVDNGAVLFVYKNDHKMFICTGRGLEGALPDAICKDIVRDQITPAFKKGDYAGGIQAGVNAMIAATKGEYKGSGQTVQEEQQGSSGENSSDSGSGGGLPFGLVIFIFILIFVVSRFFGGFGGVPMIYTGGGWGGGGGFGGFGGGGGGGGGGGFSGFSGGGGSSAGGGAGGSW